MTVSPVSTEFRSKARPIMQVTNTLSEGLKREYTVVLPAKDLEERLTGELVNIKDKVQIKGFRPGKVPMNHLRRVYGRSVMGDVLQNVVNETNRKIVEDNSFRLAMEPKIEFPEDKAVVEAAMEARGDLEYKIALEILPAIEIADFGAIKLTRLVVEPTDAEVTETLESMAAQNRPFVAKGDEAMSAKGDRVIIDFVGKVDGVEFQGGTGTDVPLELGSGSFIPGFEDQLIGLKKGDTKLVEVTFPEEYGAPHLAGQAATFDVTIKGIEEAGEAKLDDELAKTFGMETFEALKDAVKSNLARDYANVARTRLKKELLDALDAQYAFDLPPSLVEQEFEGIWRQLLAEQQQSGKSFADEDTTEDETRAEYRRIAERRVRLGLVLAEIGDKAKVEVSNEELSQALMERARQFPGQERMVWEFYTKNPEAMAEIRAPLFEDKVVDHIVAGASVTEKPVTKAELADEEAAPAADDDKPKKAAKPKAAKAKKAADAE
jgi:trigger factor